MGELVVVVGGANLDLEAAADAPARLGDSNPGRLRRGAGGVGRNIAENLARLGVEVELLTIVDDDVDGRWLADHARAAGIGLTWAEHRADTPSTYLSVLDSSGEMVVAVNDMRGVMAMDGGWLQARSAAIAAAKILVVDANLTSKAIAHLAASHPGALVVTEPVSEAKARRLRPHLAWIHTVKPNVAELAVLTHRPISDDADLDAAIDTVLRAGVSQVVVSLGAGGVVVATPDGRARLTQPRTAVVSVTGAGDAMTAGLVVGLCRGWPAVSAARFGQHLAARTAAVRTSVAPDLHPDDITAHPDHVPAHPESAL